MQSITGTSLLKAFCKANADGHRLAQQVPPSTAKQWNLFRASTRILNNPAKSQNKPCKTSVVKFDT